MGYCDANMVGGAFCPEFDIMEANKHAFRTTNHHCTSPGNGHYDWCDRAGSCTVDIITDFPDTEPYGPGPMYTINTHRQFHVKIRFIEDDQGLFAQYRVTISQDGKEVVMHKDCPEFLSKLTGVMQNGMALAMSIWTDTSRENAFDWL